MPNLAVTPLLHALSPFPLMMQCFEPYVHWFVENVKDKSDGYDLIDALRENRHEELHKLESLLSEAREILGISESSFISSFGFNSDLCVKDPEKIHDILAEPLFVIDLYDNGFSKITKLPQSIKRDNQVLMNSDFSAVRCNHKFAIELKTIRMEAKPKPMPGILLGNSMKPSWWTEMFYDNAIAKIEDKNCRVLRQLKNTMTEYQCDKNMLALYSRRVGPSTLMNHDEYTKQLIRISAKYPSLDYIVSKNYFGETVFYPTLSS